MDYKELIKTLRRYGLANGSALGRHMGIMDTAADAIETLLAERDAAMRDLRGYCRTCIHANIRQPDYPCIKCKHLKFYGTQEIDGWEWRGPQREEKPHGN